MVIAIDGLAHAGKGDFGAAIQRLTANAIGYGVEDAGTMLAEAAYRTDAHRPTRCADADGPQRPRHPPPASSTRSGLTATGLAGLVVKGPGVYADDAFPDADERCFVRTRHDRRLQRAEKVEIGGLVRIRVDSGRFGQWAAATTASRSARRTSKARDISEQRRSAEEIQTRRDPRRPRRPRTQDCPTHGLRGADTITEDLLAVPWLG